MTADPPRPVEVTAASSQAGLPAATTRLGWTPPVQTWDLGDAEPRDVETRVEWGVRRAGDPDIHACDQEVARAWADVMSGPMITLVSRTVHVGPWEVAS